MVGRKYKRVKWGQWASNGARNGANGTRSTTTGSANAARKNTAKGGSGARPRGGRSEGRQVVVESIEASGKSIEDATINALARLGRNRDEVEITVLQTASTWLARYERS